MPRKAVEVPETGAQVEILLPLARRGRADGDGGRSRGKPPTVPTIPRITRLMALAIKFQDMVDQGEVADYAAIARLGYVTRARLTQIMNLLLLAPEIQEAILFLPRLQRGRELIQEHQIRPIAANPDWAAQRRLWAQLAGAKLAER